MAKLDISWTSEVSEWVKVSHHTSGSQTGETCTQRNATRCYMAALLPSQQEEILQGFTKHTTNGCAKQRLQNENIGSFITCSVVPLSPPTSLLVTERNLLMKIHPILSKSQCRNVFFFERG